MRRFVLGCLILTFSLFLSACSKLRPAKAGIQVVTNTPAAVELDGKEVGISPYTSSTLTAKKYAIRLRPQDSGYQIHETSIKLTSGFQAMVDWSFGKTKDESSGVILQIDDAQNKNKAEIEILATPDNVPVSIDGQTKGFTPLPLDELSEGKHTIQLQAPSFEPIVRDVVLIKGKRITLSVKLAKKATPSPTPQAVATESAQVATPAAQVKIRATSTPAPTPKSSSASSSAKTSDVLTKSTTTKPYVQIVNSPTGWLRVRSQPSVGSSELAKLANDSTVPYLASQSGWLKVTYSGSDAGWVSDQYAKLVQ